MSSLFAPPPPPIATAYPGGSTSSGAIVVSQPHYSDNSNDSSPSSSSSSPSTSIVIVIIVVASAIIVSATIYLLLRFIAKRCSRRTFQTFSATSADDDHNNDVIMRSNVNASGAAAGPCFDERHLTSNNTLLESLPLFTFGSVTGNLTGVECAVCLSKFELQDQLRLLPLCCHAFHARCIDAWLVSNLTCPLCRSSVNPTDSEVFSKILPPNDIRRTSNADNIGGGGEGGGSFRVEIGSVSRRHGRSDSADDGRRSYSIGSFEYIVDDGYAVSVDSTHRRGLSECTSVDNKESVGSIPIPAPPGESLAGEVSSAGRSWLRDYVDRLGSFSFSSRTMSFRSSGRFFAGSSRRSDVVVPVEDLEANRMGEEISELFRWLSGV